MGNRTDNGRGRHRRGGNVVMDERHGDGRSITRQTALFLDPVRLGVLCSIFRCLRSEEAFPTLLPFAQGRNSCLLWCEEPTRPGANNTLLRFVKDTTSSVKKQRPPCLARGVSAQDRADLLPS